MSFQPGDKIEALIDLHVDASPSVHKGDRYFVVSATDYRVEIKFENYRFDTSKFKLHRRRFEPGDRVVYIDHTPDLVFGEEYTVCEARYNEITARYGGLITVTKKGMGFRGSDFEFARHRPTSTLKAIRSAWQIILK